MYVRPMSHIQHKRNVDQAWVPYALVTFSVLAQEGARLGYFHWYSKFENSFSVVSTNAVAFPLIDFYSALSAGMGFGVMSTTLLYGTVLSHSSGPGTVFAETCTHFSMYIIAGAYGCNEGASSAACVFMDTCGGWE